MVGLLERQKIHRSVRICETAGHAPRHVVVYPSAKRFFKGKTDPTRPSVGHRHLASRSSQDIWDSPV